MDELIFNTRFEAVDYANGHGMIVEQMPDGRWKCVEQPMAESEPADMTDFNTACKAFRAVCKDIGTLIGINDFRGGFEDFDMFRASKAFKTLDGLHLAMEWSAANELCKYEGQKVGLGQPDWFYECWKGNEK